MWKTSIGAKRQRVIVEARQAQRKMALLELAGGRTVKAGPRRAAAQAAPDAAGGAGCAGGLPPLAQPRDQAVCQAGQGCLACAASPRGPAFAAKEDLLPEAWALDVSFQPRLNFQLLSSFPQRLQRAEQGCALCAVARSACTGRAGCLAPAAGMPQAARLDAAPAQPAGLCADRGQSAVQGAEVQAEVQAEVRAGVQTEVQAKLQAAVQGRPAGQAQAASREKPASLRAVLRRHACGKAKAKAEDGCLMSLYREAAAELFRQAVAESTQASQPGHPVQAGQPAQTKQTNQTSHACQACQRGRPSQRRASLALFLDLDPGEQKRGEASGAPGKLAEASQASNGQAQAPVAPSRSRAFQSPLKAGRELSQRDGARCAGCARGNARPAAPVPRQFPDLQGAARRPQAQMQADCRQGSARRSCRRQARQMSKRQMPAAMQPSPLARPAQSRPGQARLEPGPSDLARPAAGHSG